MEKPKDIPCLKLGTSWIYKFPAVRDPKGFPVKTSFSCVNLKSAIKFDDALNVLTLNTNGVLPSPGG